MIKNWLCSLAFLPVTALAQDTTLLSPGRNGALQLTPAGAAQLAALPLKCLQQEYPNKTGHISGSDTDHVLTPHVLHPAFYGCFDWHSCVHGHWMLVYLLQHFPDLPGREKAVQAISQNLTPANIAVETDYFRRKLSNNFERTYGWAWLLKLQQELNSYDTPEGRQWRRALQPLSDTVVQLWMRFLPKQTYANRTGVHGNTAFGLVFALDYARATGNAVFEAAIVQAARNLYGNDTNAPASWEPDGSDFLSPALEEADLMRRVLDTAAFRRWFDGFLPLASVQHLAQLPVVSDRSDLQIVHLDGLGFSRSWCMRGIAQCLPDNDPRKPLLLQSAQAHLQHSLPHVAGGHYGGEHWLASFAVYALAGQ
jgi:hypothetical protein